MVAFFFFLTGVICKFRTSSPGITSNVIQMLQNTKKCSWQILCNQAACTVKPWFVFLSLYVFVDASTSLHYFSDLWCKNNDGKQCTTSGTNQMLRGLRLHRLAFDCCSNDHFFTHIWSQTWRIHQNIWMFIVHWDSWNDCQSSWLE